MQAYKVVKVRRRWKKKTKVKAVICALLVFLILALVYYFAVVCPAVVALSQEKIRSIATQTISEVVGEVLKQGKDKKIKIFKYNAKKKYRKTQGHRQPYTKVEIKKIEEK